jgi:prophage tail gpP-like protein
VSAGPIVVKIGGGATLAGRVPDPVRTALGGGGTTITVRPRERTP